MLPAKADRAPGAPVVAARALTLAAVVVLAVVGCGDEDDEGDGAPAGGGTELEITLDPDGPRGEEPMVASEACDAGAFHAHCARLKPTDLAPLDPATPCTEIFGGPDVVTIEGTIDGEEVNAALNRSNGCEIERFDRLVPLLRELFPGYEPGGSLKR